MRLKSKKHRKRAKGNKVMDNVIGIIAGVALLIIILCAGGVILTGGSGKKEVTDLDNSWKIVCEKCTDKKLEKTFKVGQDQKIHVELSQNSGKISIKAQDKDKKVLFDENKVTESSFDIAGTGKITVTIKLKKYDGTITMKVKGNELKETEESSSETEETESEKAGQEEESSDTASSEVETESVQETTQKVQTEGDDLTEWVPMLGNPANKNCNFSYEVSEKAMNFMEDNRLLFPDGAEKEIKELTNKSLSYDNVILNPDRYGNTFMHLSKAEVTEIKEVELSKKKYITELLLKDKKDHYYWLLYDAELPDVLEKNKLEVYGLPLGVTDLETGDGEENKAVVLLGSFIKKVKGNFITNLFG